MSKFTDTHAAHELRNYDYPSLLCTCGVRVALDNPIPIEQLPWTMQKTLLRRAHAAHVEAMLTDAGCVVVDLRMVEDLADPDPCQWDHNHSCQAHGYYYLEQGDLCPHEEAKRVLAAAAAARSVPATTKGTR